jgi:hypothetical protein
VKTVKNADGSYTTTASLGEALMQPFMDVNEWTEEEKTFYDKECKAYLDRILVYKPNPSLDWRFNSGMD